jgi:hypothetical protein
MAHRSQRIDGLQDAAMSYVETGRERPRARSAVEVSQE